MRKLLLIAVLAGCSDEGAVHSLPDAPPAPDASPDAGGCPAVTGAGTMHPTGAVNQPETWTAAASPHLVRSDLSITAKLVIEDCAVVRIANDRRIVVRATGALEARGLPGREVRFERDDPNASWSSIAVLGGGTLSLVHTVVTGGGDPQNTLPILAAAIDVAGATPTTAPILHADHLVVEGSQTQGIMVHDGGGFTPTSTALRITGSAGAPLHTFARHAGTIPDGDYTGNGRDVIVLRATGGPEAITESQTLHARNVPYHVGIQPNATLDVGVITGAPAVLTIDPGTTLRFEPSAMMRIDAASSTVAARGALIAVGTAAAPIVFTSGAATPAAGDWFGLRFGGIPDAATRMDHTRVEFAGRLGSSGSDSCVPPGQLGPNDAAIRLLGAEPTPVFITNTAIHASARHGIDRGYRSDTKPDFMPTNTFTAITGCKQTLQRDLTGACPASPPCP